MALMIPGSILIDSHGGAIYGSAGESDSVVIENSIFSGNYAYEGGAFVISTDGGVFELVCNNFYGNIDNPLTLGEIDADGNFAANPLLCVDGAYLAPSSPCLPDNSPCGTLVGAKGVGCGDCGDVDFDGVVTEADIDLLQEVYFGYLIPGYTASEGDLNCDGSIDIADIVMLAGYYYGYGPSPCCAPSPPKRQEWPERDMDKGGPGF
jgi:hypothetical protein